MQTLGLRWSLVVLLALTFTTASARAADDPQRAKELFQQGTTYFDVGQFDKAIESWQEGYKAKPDPGFLYNIAQAYRLSGDAQKAIFFYKGFLRYSPKAPNRADVEQKIAALQKQINEGKPTTPPTTSPPTQTTTPPPPPPPGNGAPPVVAAGPPPLSPPYPPGTFPHEPPPVEAPPVIPPPGPPVVVSPPEGQAPGARPRPFDLAAAMGGDFWASGPSRSAQPSFAVMVSGGYSFGAASARRARFRIGAAFGYTFLAEEDAAKQTFRETFLSFVVEPGVSVRLTARRLYLQAGLGIGGLVIQNLKSSSSLLVAGNYTITGAQGMLELRPAASLEYLLTPALSLFAGPALAYSPQKPHFHAPISRFELSAGLAFRF